jgi:hypothetical protein
VEATSETVGREDRERKTEDGEQNSQQAAAREKDSLSHELTISDLPLQHGGSITVDMLKTRTAQTCDEFPAY